MLRPLGIFVLLEILPPTYCNYQLPAFFNSAIMFPNLDRCKLIPPRCRELLENRGSLLELENQETSRQEEILTVLKCEYKRLSSLK